MQIVPEDRGMICRRFLIVVFYDPIAMSKVYRQ